MYENYVVLSFYLECNLQYKILYRIKFHKNVDIEKSS